MDNNLILWDVETLTTWPQLLLIGTAGARAGVCLEMGRNNVATTWSFWRRLHPETVVLSDQNEALTPVKSAWYAINPYEALHAGVEPLPYVPSVQDNRLPERELVIGVHARNGRAALIPHHEVGQLQVGDTPVVVFHHPTSRTSFVFENALEARALTFESVGVGVDELPRFRDRETGSLWSIDGLAVEGAMAGKRLPQLPATELYWFAWSSFWPGTPVYSL